MLKLMKKVARYFPYAKVRPFQDEFIRTVYDAVENGANVIIEGSNGLGKTVAALSACLPVALERGLQILYVAKTHRQHDRVVEELLAISKKQRVSGLSVRGRSEMCLHPTVVRRASDARTIMEVCEMLKSEDKCPYYYRIEREFERYAELQQHVLLKPFKASEIHRICRVEGFCPYELIKASLSEVNVIALSYLYVFDPRIQAFFLKNLEKGLGKVLLIVDEAHNLPETAVEIASDSLTAFTLKQAENEAKRFEYDDVAEFCKGFRAVLEELSGKNRKETVVSPQLIIEIVERESGIDDAALFLEELHELGMVIKRRLLNEGRFPRSYIHRTAEFLLNWTETAEDPSFVHTLTRYMTRTGTASIKLEIVALDPSKITMPVFSSVYCSVVMSGTLQPLDAYAKITQLTGNSVKTVIPPPFPEENILALVCRGVTTAMTRRTEDMYRKIVERIAEAVHYTPANVGVFTASYEVLEALLKVGLQDFLDKPLFYERRKMRSRENARLISQFKSYAKRGGAVLLGVQGGRSSEGVDYPGDQMNSVLIVGVPYAEPTPKVQAQIEYFERCFPGYGREYGYVLPAMKKAAQAAGRPVRRLNDKGAIIFLDYRFSTRYCQRFLPSWIRRSLKVLPDERRLIGKELKKFFQPRN
jgi:DNA excision repair protein ERCC-2